VDHQLAMSLFLHAQQEPSALFHFDGEIPVDLPGGAFISITRTPPLKIYSLGFQPAKTIPEIPRWFLSKYASVPFTVLDPFAGSGTTVIESLKYGASVWWLDYHPLSQLICRVKTTKFSPYKVAAAISSILESARRAKSVLQIITFANKDFWFQKSVQEGLEILRQRILEADIYIQPVLWLAFASTVRKSSNMNDGMLLAARRHHIKGIPKYSREDVFRYFQLYAEKALDAVTEWNRVISDPSKYAKEMPAKDARCVNGYDRYDAVITSPPYINAIDYVWASKFELHWLDLVKSDEDRLNLYQQEIGTERIPNGECRELGRTGNNHLDQMIEDIYLGNKYKATKGQNMLRARVVYKYFIDMKDHFVKCFEQIQSGGYYCFTVGDANRICGVHIPVASTLTEIASEVGFRRIFSFRLLLKNRKLNVPRNVEWADTIKHDTTVVLQKPTI
jgi:hypothetical protein